MCVCVCAPVLSIDNFVANFMVLDVLNELRVADTIYNFSAFYVTITVLTASRHVISVEATSITFTFSHSSSFRFVLILS